MTCDRCHKYDHATKGCCVRLGVPSSSGVQQVQQNNNQKPKATGRIFAINGAEASQCDSLVKGICYIFGTQLFFCLILEQLIPLFMLIVLRNLNC